QDLEIISEVSTRQGIPIPVLNGAIHYVMLQSNHQLSKRYLETIVSHWSRLGYTTAKQAVDHVLNMSKEKPQRRHSYVSKKESNEVIPDWFKERKKPKKESVDKQTKVDNPSLDEKERKELEALLKRHTSKNN